MGKNSKDWKDGYQAAIEAIKKALSGDQQSNKGMGSDEGEGLPSDMTPPPGGSGDGDKSSFENGSSGSSDKSERSRTDKSNPNQGIVRPEDCVSGNRGVQSTPSTPGGFFEKSDGDKLAEKEGYEKEGGNEGTVEKEWQDAALKAAKEINKEPGTAIGKLKSALEGLYKVSTDWKKSLRQVVGKSINPAETRQAYANKNILISQDRIARTDKDKYDNMDYMIAWIDSSGSMSDDQLKMCLSEVYSVAVAKKPIKLYVIQCDTKIQEIKEYKSLPELKKDMIHATVKGRGGTDVKPLWDLLRNDKKFNKVRPDLCMIFTDGYLTQYKRDRRTMSNLCWCIIDNPSFNVQYPDTQTKMIHIKSADVK